MSYDGHLDFGIVADREQMRDVWKLIDWLGEELERLLPEGYREAADAAAAAAAEAGGLTAESADEPSESPAA